ncbi:MAG: carbamoyltransferase HypF, partial [Planctomycetota bacterium]|nr:carbamoyltransferase HypF [Planctomycetota bacterium]
PDIRVCAACLAELRDPRDRRYGYAFIACACCGPRYTILEALPFDREHTTMRDFPLCAACRAEYEDPASRRFHAQAIACPDCGPHLRLLDAQGREIAGDPIVRGAEILRCGGILAIKGIGGFHLACDAAAESAVAQLRARKRREAKPLAVMAANAAVALGLVEVSADAENDLRALWESPEAPIVIAPKRLTRGREPLAKSVAPGCDTYGVMLPYAPLHFLLFDAAPPTLVMTSANLSEEPICCDNAEAMSRLAGIADAFLLHDRRIRWRADDSVIIFPPTPSPTAPMILVRRSRGFVPRGMPAACEVDGIVGYGALLKNTFAVGKGSAIYPGPHVGDLDNDLAWAMYQEALANFLEMLQVQPRLAACDLHPDFPSTRLAEASGLPLVRVQHHHAHLAALLAETGAEAPALGFAFDGTGLGEDGNIWGGEVMAFDAANCERLWHLEYVPLPGGDRAAAEPWRMAVSYLWHHGFEPERYVSEAGAAEVKALLASAIPQPRTSSLGRL